MFCGLRDRASSCSRVFFERVLPNVVIAPRYLWIFTLGGVFACALVAIFHHPGVRLPDQEDFQLFRRDHYFERYDRQFRSAFGFERAEKRDVSMRMPLRFVWGLRPEDDGDRLDPSDRGRLHLDPGFDMATKDAQRWLLKFCEDVRKQVCIDLVGLFILVHLYVQLYSSILLLLYDDSIPDQLHI